MEQQSGTNSRFVCCKQLLRLPKMKLIIVAALIGVCAAGRLEHLERGYLPPDHSHSNGQSSFNSHGSSGFGSGSNGFSGSSGGFGSASHSANSIETSQLKQYLPPDHGPSGGNFGGSFFQRSGSHGASNFGSSQRFAAPSQQYGAPSQQYGAPSQQYGAPSQQYGAPSQQYGAPSQQFGGASSQSFGGASSQSFGSAHGSNSFQGAPSQQYGSPSQFGQSGQTQQHSFGSSAQNRQYLAPKSTPNNFQNIPQQAFDEQTGYHY